jgi:hypothetical protein
VGLSLSSFYYADIGIFWFVYPKRLKTTGRYLPKVCDSLFAGLCFRGQDAEEKPGWPPMNADERR